MKTKYIRAYDYFRYRRKKGEEGRRTASEFNNATFTNDYLNIGKLIFVPS